MRLSKTSQRILLVAVLTLIFSAAIFTLAPKEIIRCYLVRWSDLEEISPNLFVDPQMPETQRQSLLSSLTESETRIETLYGDITANPVIIAGHTMEVMKTYGGNLYNRTGRTYLTLARTFIILGPDGMRSVDALSHELVHAEFSERIGHWNRSEIPNWFDEGLAVQFDDRISLAVWRTRTDDGETAPDLDQIGTIEHNDWLGYATSKHEVQRWLDIVGQSGFLEFLQAIRNGDDFNETYRSIERDHSTSQ
jgi:hypothetical protein